MNEVIVKKEIHYSKELNRDVTVYIMLPQGYETSEKIYPVLYMQDGHNLFYEADASYGTTWGIIEAFKNEDLPEIIIVGLDCAPGNDRLDEYSPWTSDAIEVLYPDRIDRAVGGKGDSYLEYLTGVIKPMIEATYPASVNPEHIGIGGSSMGGLISTYGVAKYPHMFTRAIAVSNAYWFALPELVEFINNTNYNHVKKLYMDVGTNEIEGDALSNQHYMDSNNQVYEALNTQLNQSVLRYEIIKDGIHNEAHWAKRIGEIIRFTFDDLR